MNKILTILDEMRKLREGASPGPWYISGNGAKTLNPRNEDVYGWAYLNNIDESLGGLFETIVFIASSPALCDKYDRALRVATQDLQSFRNLDHDLKMRNLAQSSLDEIEAILAEQK